MKRLLSFMFLLVVLYFLTETNPTRTEYVEWLNEKAVDQSANFFEKGVISLIGQTISDAATTRSNYYFFSIYTTDFTKFGKGKIITVGVFNQFITIPK